MQVGQAESHSSLTHARQGTTFTSSTATKEQRFTKQLLLLYLSTNSRRALIAA